MIIKIREFILKYRSISIYTIIGVLNNLILLLGSIFIMNKISTIEYGKIVYFTMILSVVTPISSLNSTSYYWKDFFKYNNNKIIFYYIYIFKIFILFFIFFFIFIFDINQFLKTDFQKFLLFIPIIILSTDSKDDIFTLLIYTKQIKKYTIISLSLTLLDVISFYILLNFYKNNFESRIISYCIVSVVNILFFFYFFIEIKQIKILKLHELKKSISVFLFSVPLVFQNYSKLSMNFLDRWFLVTLVSTTSLAIYNFGYQFGSMISIVLVAIINYYSPSFYKFLGENKLKEFNLISKKYHLFIFSCVFLIIIFYILFYFFSPSFYPSIYKKSSIFILFSGFSSIIFSIVSPYMAVLGYFNKTKIIGYIGVVTLIINFILSYLLINKYYELGAAWSTIFSYAFYAFLIYYYGNNELKKNQK